MAAHTALVQYSEAAQCLLRFLPTFADAMDLLRDECGRHPDTLVEVASDHPHGLTVLALFCSKNRTLTIDTQSKRTPSPCIFSEEAVSRRHCAGTWKASVPMSLDAVFAFVYDKKRPEVDTEVDMSDIQDRIASAEDGVPFRIATYGVERVFQKLGRPCEGFGVMYQTHHPERARMLLFQPLVCKLYSQK